MPSQPRWPTYFGRKKRFGSAPTSTSCAPGGAAHHMATRSSWWWSDVVTKVFLSCTNQVGSPWERRSVTSGRERQRRRRVSRGSPTDSPAPIPLVLHRCLERRQFLIPPVRDLLQAPLR